MIRFIQIRNLLLLLMTFISTGVNAIECSSDSHLTKIYFINGVLASKAAAVASKKAIENAYKPQLEKLYPNEQFIFEVSYNYSAKDEGFGTGVFDFIEFFQQRLAELSLKFEKYIAPQYFNAFISGNWEDILNDSQVQPGDLAKLKTLHSNAMNFYTSNWPNKSDSDSHVRQYVNDLTEGKRVILIAHSQGNMFAQRAMTILEPRYGLSIGMIGVASPASVEMGNSSHYTATDDRVIQFLRNFTDVLEANVENDPGVWNDSRDLDNHGFLKSYFASGLESRLQIDSDFFDKVSYLERMPSPLLKLSWSNNGKGIYDHPNYHSYQCGTTELGEIICDYSDIGMLPIEVAKCNLLFAEELTSYENNQVKIIAIPSPNSMTWTQGYEHNIYTIDNTVTKVLAPYYMSDIEFTGPYTSIYGTSYYKVQKAIHNNMAEVEFYAEEGKVMSKANFFNSITQTYEGQGINVNSTSPDMSLIPESCFDSNGGASSWCTGSFLYL